jgi:AraC-like DNA-binding protein
VIRYPQNAVVVREADVAQRWRAVCLYLRPQGIGELLQLPALDTISGLEWLASDGDFGFYSRRLNLHPAMMLIASDILSCQYEGTLRHAYMRAKSIELTCSIVRALRSASMDQGGLTAPDLRRIRRARAMLEEDGETRRPLEGLARAVGLNRTKLAAGFKLVYGESVQAYRRNLWLAKARDLLLDGDCTVTEAALVAGYTDISAFSRAYRRNFGVSPRQTLRSV